MENVKYLKDQCAQKLSEVNSKLISLKTELIKKDINNYISDYKLAQQYGNHHYLIADEVTAYIDNQALLIIDDHHRSIFRWLFDIQLSIKIRDNDYMIINEYPTRVQDLPNIVNNDILKDVEDLIAEIDSTLSIINSNIQIDSWHYSYICENTKMDNLSSLSEVIELVLSRKH